MVLAQITWWLQPAQRDGRRRTQCTTERDGHLWLFLSDAEFGSDVGMSADQVYRARQSLRRANAFRPALIESKSAHVDGRKVTLLRPILAVEDSADARNTDREVAEPPAAASRNTRRGVAESTSNRDLQDQEQDPADAEVDRLCTLLADLIEANGSKRPTITARWRTECDRLLRLDGRAPEKIEACIRWCQADPFWRGNILSMPTLRQKYDQLRLAAKRDPKPKGTLSQIREVPFDEGGMIVQEGCA